LRRRLERQVAGNLRCRLKSDAALRIDDARLPHTSELDRDSDKRAHPYRAQHLSPIRLRQADLRQGQPLVRVIDRQHHVTVGDESEDAIDAESREGAIPSDRQRPDQRQPDTE